MQAQVADEQGEKIEGADGNELETPLKDDNKANLPRLSKKVLLTQRKEGDGKRDDAEAERGEERNNNTSKLTLVFLKLLFLFAFTCFAVIGNLYYSQPLLVRMG